MSGGPRFHVPVGIVALAVPPDSPVIGETYFDTALGQLQSWDGTVWVGSSSDTELDIDFVNVPGDAMTGELVLPDQVVVPPSAPAVVAAKGYVDQLVTVSDVPPTVAPARDGLIWSVVQEKPTYADRIVSLNPLSYWRLGEAVPGAGAVDEMGLYGCTYLGSMTLGVPGLLAGDTDTAMQLTGVYGPNGAMAGNPVEYQLNDVFTIEAWIKTSDAGTSLRSIVVKQNSFGLFLMDNCVCPYEWTGGGFINSNINVADDKPHHLVVVYNGSESQTYLDGSPVGPMFTHASMSQVGNLAIGFNDYNGQEWIGVIDEVAIYGRALTAEEVAGNYQMGSVTQRRGGL